MTEEQIKQKAFEAYPKNESEIDGYDWNENEREAYIKALKETESLPKLKGWVARDKNGEINYFQEYPRRITEDRRNYWWDRDYISMCIDENSFPELTWEDEPIEVELLIRKL